MSVSGDRKMTKRLEMLKASLVKKEAELDRRMQAHFDTVKEANGQPLNDKRNGQATLNKWEKQNDAIRNQQAEIEKTKRAIEFEEGKIAHVGSVSVPSFITDLIDAGEITQWRKYPNRFFVVGVDKARIVWLEKENAFAHQYVKLITDKAQYAIFCEVFNKIKALHSAAN